MPRTARISITECRTWLGWHERGKGVDEIAKDAHRAISSIWKGIDRARREREVIAVHQELLRDAYKAHFEDLLDQARTIRAAASTMDPRGLTPADRTEQMLAKGLRSHIPDSPLWRAIATWNINAKTPDELAEELETQVDELVDAAISPDVRDLARPGGFAASLRSAILDTAMGKEVSREPYQVERTANGPVLRWGTSALSIGAPDESALEPVQESHERLIEQIATLGLSRFSNALQRWSDARERIEAEVETLVLRHMIEGQCELCPGGHGAGTTGTRTRRRTR